MEGGNGLRCLRCSAPIEAEFGIVACTQCGAVMMIDMDGQLQLADDPAEAAPIDAIESASEPLPEQSLDFGNQNEMETVARPFEAFAPESAEAPASFEAAPGLIEEEVPAPAENQDFGGFAASEEAAPAEEMMAAEPVAEEPVPEESVPVAETAAPAQEESWFDQGLDQALSPASELPANEVDPQLASSDFSDVASFGNQDADAGALQFELILSQLDHADLVKEVFEVLADPRFFLNVKELRDQFSQGILTVPHLSAARTSLIVNRLRHLKINIQWRQKLYES